MPSRSMMSSARSLTNRFVIRLFRRRFVIRLFRRYSNSSMCVERLHFFPLRTALERNSDAAVIAPQRYRGLRRASSSFNLFAFAGSRGVVDNVWRSTSSIPTRIQKMAWEQLQPRLPASRSGRTQGRWQAAAVDGKHAATEPDEAFLPA